MKLSWKALLVLASVFVASAGLASVLPASEIQRIVAATPGIAALIGAVFVVLRDVAAHEHAVALHRDDQHFQVGATSHMSNVVFDKHVQFCEAYMAKVLETVDTLVRNHADIEAVTRANELYQVRRAHATWVTAAMSARLSQFEDAVRKMGAKANFVHTTVGNAQYAEQRAAAIPSVYADFQRILPHLFGQVAEDGIGSETIEERVRDMLGVNELLAMRTKLVARAHKALTD